MCARICVVARWRCSTAHAPHMLACTHRRGWRQCDTARRRTDRPWVRPHVDTRAHAHAHAQVCRAAAAGCGCSARSLRLGGRTGMRAHTRTSMRTCMHAHACRHVRTHEQLSIDTAPAAPAGADRLMTSAETSAEPYAAMQCSAQGNRARCLVMLGRDAEVQHTLHTCTPNRTHGLHSTTRCGTATLRRTALHRTIGSRCDARCCRTA